MGVLLVTCWVNLGLVESLQMALDNRSLRIYNQHSCGAHGDTLLSQACLITKGSSSSHPCDILHETPTCIQNIKHNTDIVSMFDTDVCRTPNTIRDWDVRAS